MSDFVRPHRWQPTRLHHPWHSPSKNTGVGCHFLLQCMKVKSESEVTQLCLGLVALRYVEYSWTRDQTCVPCIARQILNHWTTRKVYFFILLHGFIIFYDMDTTTTTTSLQSCPTLCDPVDGSPPGSAIPGILQARTLEWVAISFSNA